MKKQPAQVNVNRFITIMNEAKAKYANTNESRWYKDVLLYDWKHANRDARGFTWVNVYMILGGKRGSLYLSAENEMHRAWICPIKEADLNIMNEKMKNKKTLRTADREPHILINKFSEAPIVDETTGEIIEPPEEYISSLFKAIDLYNSAFQTEIMYQKKQGSLATYDDNIDGNDKPGTIFVPNTRFISMVQTHVSKKSQDKTMAGKPIPNPIVRFKLGLTGKSKKITKFFDKSQSFLSGDKQRYQPAKIDGKEISNENVHRILTPGTIVDILIDMSTVCCSPFGVSTTSKILICVVSPRVANNDELDVDALYDNDDGIETTLKSLGISDEQKDENEGNDMMKIYQES